MRNLKRALSLTLASVMLLGMMVLGTSALSYTDADSVENLEAVDVMKATEIMLGNGSDFGPGETVTRAQMAIIVIKMIYGADMNVKQFAGETKFSDVPANSYYSGYVNLATQLNIINGYGNGQFGPADPVTTAQAALMITKALGYFESNSELGDSWVLTAITKATEIGLFGSLKLDRNAGLSRDNVAEMVFKAITKATPVAKNEIFGYYTVGGTLTGGVLDGELSSANYQCTLGYKIHDLNTSAKSNHGERGHVWVNRISSAVLTDFYSTDKVLGTSADGTKISKLTTKTESKFQAELDTTDTYYAFYHNGTKLAVLTADGSVSHPDGLYVYNNMVQKATGGTADVDADPEYSVKGAIVTLRDIKEGDGTYDGKAEVVTIVEKTVTKLSRDAVTEVSGATTTLKYAIGVVDTDVPVEYIHGYEGLKKDDVILSVKLEGGHDNQAHYYLEKAESAEGEVSAIRAIQSDGVKRDRYTLSSSSTAYEESGLVNEGKGIVTSDAKLGAEVAFYLDNGGYVVYTKLLDAADENYAVILDYDDRTMEGQKTKLLLTDGTTPVVNADYKVGDTTKEMIESVVDADKEVEITKEQALVEYSIEGGVYKLKAVPAATASDMGSVTVDQVNRNVALLKSGGSVYANDRTVFVLRDNTTAKAISTYTGISNVPDVTSGTFLAVGKGASVSYVFVMGAQASISDDQIFYITEIKHNLKNTYKSDGTVDKNLAEYKVVMNGEVTTLTGLKGTMEAVITGTGAYRVGSYDSEGYVNGLTKIPDSTPDTYYEGNLNYGTAVWAMDWDGHTLTYNGGGAVVDDKTTWVRVNKDGVASLGSEADVQATTTAGEKYTPVIVTYRVDNGAQTGLADVIFVFNDTVASGAGMNVVVAAETPTISTDLDDTTPVEVTAGSITGNLVVAASVSDGGTLSYQLKKDGVNSGASGASGTIAIPTDLTAGTYKFTIVVTNTIAGDTPGTASATSKQATVIVKPETPTNMSSGHTATTAGAVTINGTSAWPEGTYKLYVGTATTAAKSLTVTGSGTNNLEFTGVTGLSGVATNFYITVTINGVESEKTAAISITPA